MYSAGSKKRKRDSRADGFHSAETSKPSASYVPDGGRSYTVSVAVPGSIIANAQSHDLKTNLAGQIGRALAVFCVDEVVIFNDGQNHTGRYDRRPNSQHYRKDSQDGKNVDSAGFEGDSAGGYSGWSDPEQFLYHVLSYIEVPPYLRKALFPLHQNLRTAGTLPSLAMPHHLAANEWCPYRDGVTLPSHKGLGGEKGEEEGSGEPALQKEKKKKGKEGKDSKSQTKQSSTPVDVGLPTLLSVPVSIPPNVRVTLKLTHPSPSSFPSVLPSSAIPVDPSEPRKEAGYYWGYSTRRASSLSAVFTECPYPEGYDLSFGTSERGVPLEDAIGESRKSKSTKTARDTRFTHLLVAVGGLGGLEAALRADNELKEKGVTRVQDLFDHWVNVCSGQGSKTIRTEEALWLALMGLRSFIRRNGKTGEERTPDGHSES